MYRLQMRKTAWSNAYITLPERYETLDEARMALDEKGMARPEYRIVEEYTVIRYKEVKTDVRR